MRLWDVASRHELWARKVHTDRVISLGFSPDGTRLASGSDDRTINIWDVANGQLLHTLKGHSEGILCVAFSPRGERLASGSFDGTVKIWDIASRQELRTLKGHTGCVLSVAFSPDGWRLASAGSDMTVKVWDATPLTLDVQEEREALGAMAFEPKGLCLSAAQGSPRRRNRHTGRFAGTQSDLAEEAHRFSSKHENAEFPVE